MVPGVVLPVTLQRAVPAPWKGLLAGIWPSAVILRIFPISTSRPREAKLAPAHWEGLAQSQPPSPTET